MMDENTALFTINLAVYILCGCIFVIMPRLTAKSFLFGVKIPSEQAGCPEAVSLKKQYVRACLLGALFMIFMCVIQYVLWPKMTLLAVMYFPFLLIPLCFAAYVPNWKKALRLKEEKRWHTAEMPFTETGPDGDKHWFWGMFYHNRDDPAYIVRSRFGTNIGFNYARLPVKIGITILLLVLAAIYAWLTVNFLNGTLQT